MRAPPAARRERNAVRAVYAGADVAGLSSTAPIRVPSLKSEQPPPASIRRFLALASVALVITILSVGKVVIMPVVFAALLAFLLSPAVGRLMRWGLNKVGAIFVVLTIGFTLVGALGWMVALQMFNLAEQLPAYERNIQEKIIAIKTPDAPSPLKRTSEMLKKLQKEITSEAPSETTTAREPGEPEPVRVRVEEDEPSPFEMFNAVSGSVLPAVLTAGIVLVLMVAMLLGREDLRDRFIKVVSAGQLNLATEALDDAARRVSRYLLMQLVVNASYGIPIGLGLYFIGIPNAPLWGLLATLLRFIPFLGPWIAAVFPIVLAVAIDPGWTMIIATLALFVLMEIVSNNIIEVWLYGAGTGISNLALLVAAIFWTALWGPAGLVLSTPLTVCLLVLGRHMPGLRFLSTLLGSEPVLDPPAQLYQRMLSRDFDEMLQLAHDYIAGHSLTPFYDDVFLPALLMAENDRHRGALAEVRQQFIFTASRELIEELEQRGDTDDDEPVDGSPAARPASPAGTICCIPAADDADELVGLMARHLLRERGFRTIVCPVTASPEEQRDAIRNASANVAFVSALPPSALVPAQRARRQLKRAVPDLRIIVGIWTSHTTSVAYKERLGHKRPEATVRSLAELLAEVIRATPTPESVKAPESSVKVSAQGAQRPLGLMDFEPEGWVERVTRASAQLFEIPVSLVFLLPEDDLFWPERLGVNARTESLLEGFLKEAVGDDDLIVADDVLEEKRLAQTAFVRERGVRRLVNVVLRAEAGNIVGHLCLVDTKPRTTSAEQRALIVTIGKELVEAVTTLHSSEAVQR